MRSLRHLLLFIAGNLTSLNAHKIQVHRRDRNGNNHSADKLSSSLNSLPSTGLSGRLYTNASTTAMNCSASWSNWLDSSITYSISTALTFYSTYTYHNITAQVTTLCDGHPRIVGGLTTTATGTTTVLTSGTRNFTVPSPTCQPALSDCSSLSEGFEVFPCTKHTKGIDCGQCSIYGGTVQLLYFPTSRPTSRDLCPVTAASPGSPTLCPLAPTLHPYSVSNPFQASPCPYATSNLTSTQNSGPFVVSGGQTFFKNRAYVSIQTAFASNTCGFVGDRHPGTILTLQSSDVYSVAGYHHAFADIGYQVNFEDFNTVPAEAYYLGCNGGDEASCEYSGSRYRYGTDYINGMNTIDLGLKFQVAKSGSSVHSLDWIWDQAYAPTLLVPLQIRQLDPAWSTCSLNLQGLYDPPRALTQLPIMAAPTVPSEPFTITPSPAGSPTAAGAPQTAHPVPTSMSTNSKFEPPASSAPMEAEPTTSLLSPNPAVPNDDPARQSSSASVAGEIIKSQPSQLSPASPVNPLIGSSLASDRTQSTTNAMSVLVSAQRTFTSPGPTESLVEVPPNGDPAPDPAASTFNSNTHPSTNMPLSSDPNSSIPHLPPIVPEPSSVEFIANGRMHTVAAVPGMTGVYAIDNSLTISELGAAITADGVTISAGTEDDLVVGSQTIAMSSAETPTTVRPTGVAGSSSITADQSPSSISSFHPEATITASSAASISTRTKHCSLTIESAITIALVAFYLIRYR